MNQISAAKKPITQEIMTQSPLNTMQALNSPKKKYLRKPYLSLCDRRSVCTGFEHGLRNLELFCTFLLAALFQFLFAKTYAATPDSFFHRLLLRITILNR